MNYIANSICLLNSSYSKDKIIEIFKDIMLKAGIREFVLSSKLIQVCTTSLINLNSNLNLKCGNYNISFRYNKLDKKEILNSKDIECLISAFVVAIENSIIYKDIVDNVAFSKNKKYLSYNDLINDISNEIKHYERFGTNFCVAKILMENISLGEKFNFKLSKYIDKIKDSIRATDTVYRDTKSIYILFRNVSIDDGIKLIEKIKGIVYTNQVGIAEWKSTYVIVDLMSEIDNYIYLSQEKFELEKSSLADELNLILNKALYKNDDIVIVKKSELEDLSSPNIALSFCLNNIEYVVLKNYTDISKFSYIYKFAGDEIAEDIIDVLSSK